MGRSSGLAFAVLAPGVTGDTRPPHWWNHTMYIVTPWPNLLYALYLRKPVAPAKWTYNPQASAHSQGVACCDVVNRGAAFFEGRTYYNTLDMHTVAVDANTGQQVWKISIGDINKGESMTMAPIVVKGKVLVATAGASSMSAAG
jgi:glucose dehydrogenase